ncbi:CUB domain-containing protein 2-like [Mytilus trossulus]|uniref:CUB domain-containing protein 2-like n=1 Tax=Mytilus trossulus TaxID=6551 RepID=UPI003003DD8B
MSYGCLYTCIVVFTLLMRESKGNSIVVTNTSGIITSPNYPGEYNNDFDCEYIIQSPTKQPITLVFDDFDIEDDDDCTKDYVTVKDGANILLGKFCGDDIPYPLLALSGVIILNFHSNNKDTERGFRAVFNDSQDCVNVTKDSNGTIQSPNYPKYYPTNIICLYYIEHRQLNTCNCILLRVQDGISQSSKKLGKFCGRRIPSIPVILSGTVFVIFRSNNVAPWSGFKAEYKEYKEEPFLDCSGFLNVSMGRIQSPNHPEKYNSNTDCVYTLASKYNGLINLTFTFFEMEDPLLGNCTYDFVEINDSNTSIGKFCGLKNPVLNLTFTLSRSVRVVFHSDSSRNYKGFSANFAEITVAQTTDEVLTTVSLFTTSGNMWNNKITPFTNTSSVNPVVISAASGGLFGVIAVVTIICVIVGRHRRTETNRIKRKHPKEIDNEYSYSNLLTDDTSNNNQNADSSYYDLSDSYNGEHEIQTVIKTPTKVKTNDSEYIEQGEAYNVLNIQPPKINDTENFDRTIDEVYDKTTHITNTSYSELGLYDHSAKI